MRKIELKDVTDCSVIFSYGDTIVLSGKNPWIFRRDGTFVAKHKAIRNAYDMVFLPGNTVLMDGKVDRSYHYVSLESGEILWSLPKKGRRGVVPNQFAVSPDGQIVYYVYKINNTLYVDQIILKEKKCTTFPIMSGIMATRHCYCDSEGILSLLQSQYIKEPKADDPEYAYSIQGIRKWSPEDPVPKWKYQWKSETGSKLHPHSCNDDYILFRDFTVASFKTGETFNLLENNPELNRVSGGFSILGFDPQRQLLTILFIGSFSTVIIDCKARKIVAHYAPITRGLSGGCLIGDEFWMGTSDGVIKRTFPHIDEFPNRI